MTSTTKNRFEVKTKDLLIWNGQVVMSRTEEPLLKKIFSSLSNLRPNSVLEVGFGLGVSAALIQEFMRPIHHDIVEIDRGVFRDIRFFTRQHPSARGILGDFWDFKPTRKYDFIFYDTYAYAEDADWDLQHYDSTEDDLSWAARIRELLTDGGTVCLPTFGPNGAGSVPGFKRTIRKTFRVEPYLTEDGHMIGAGTVECWTPQPRARK